MKKFIFTMAFVCASSMAFIGCGTSTSNGNDSISNDTTVVDSLDTIADSVAVDTVVCPD